MNRKYLDGRGLWEFDAGQFRIVKSKIIMPFWKRILWRTGLYHPPYFVVEYQFERDGDAGSDTQQFHIN
jgi:hypothetical protein